MAKSLAILALLGVAATASAALPVFPNDWSSEQMQGIAINQGGIVNADGSICCPAQSPQCKIQTAFSEGMQYNDFTHNRAAFKNPDGSGVVTLFDDGKEYGVDASGACQSYCPVQGNMTAGLIPVNGTSDLGSVMYNGKKAEHYQWSVKVPIINITMQVSDFYAVLGASSATPLAEIDSIEPMGQHIGTQNTTYVTFVAGTPSAKHFTVTGKATCKLDKSCSQSSDDAPPASDVAPRDYVIRKHLGMGPLEVAPVY